MGIAILNNLTLVTINTVTIYQSFNIIYKLIIKLKQNPKLGGFFINFNKNRVLHPIKIQCQKKPTIYPPRPKYPINKIYL